MIPLELMEDGACQVTLDGPGNAKQYAFFQAVPTYAPSAGSDCLMEFNPASPDSEPPNLSDIAAGLYDDELGLYDAPYSDSARGSNHSDPGDYLQSKLSQGSNPVSTTLQGTSALTCISTGSISGSIPTSPTFHAHRPAALRVDAHVATPTSLASTVVTSPSNLARLPATQLDREVMHARAVDRLVGRLHSPNKRQHAPEPAALDNGPQHSTHSSWQWQHTMDGTGFFSTGDKLDSRISSPVRGPPAQGYGRAVGHRYPAQHWHGLQQQGERYNRPSSAWLERRHHPGLLQAPIFQAVPIPLKPTHDSPVEMRPPSFSWLPKLLLEEPLYPSCRVSDSAFEANYAQHPEPSNSDTEATATAAVEAAVVAALRKQLQDAEAKAATSRKQLAAAEARAAALAAEKSAEFGEVAWLRQQLQEADLEVQEGAEELTKAHAQQQTAAAVAAEQLAILQQKLAAAEAKAAAAEAAAGASMREQKAAEAKHAEQVAGLQTQLQAANNKVVAAEAATAKRVKEAQQAAVDRAAEHIASMHQQLQAVEDRATAAAAYVEELNTLKQQLQVAEAKSAAADAELRRLQVQGGQLEQYLSASAEELRALQANMAAARSALATFDGPSSSTASSNDDKSPTAQLGSKAADGSSKLLSLQQAITQVLGQMAGRCKAAEQQAAACHAEVHEVHSILAGTSTDGAGHATFMTQAGSADELAPDQHSLSVQQLAEAVVKDGQLVKQQAAEAQAQLEAVRSILCAACALEPDVSTPTAHRAPPEHAPSAFDSMTALQLAAAVVQAYQLAQQQSAPALCAQVKDAHALLVAASAACQGASVQAESAEPGKTPSAPAPVQVLQLKKLSAVLVDRYRSTQQQADSSQAQMHEAHAVLQAALSVAAAGSDGQGDLSLQELAAALVDRCMFAELGLDDCRKQVQNELTQLQAACASMRAYFTSTAASKQKQKGHGGKDYWMLQEVRTQLVEAQLNRMCAEQKAAVADAAAAAAVQELERVKQELRAAKSGLLAPTGLTSKQYRELQTLKRELAAAEEKVAASDSELQAMRMQLAETSAACKEAQQAQRWLPEHAAAAMAGVLGVMAVARVSTVRDDHEASAQQEDGGHSAGAGSEQAVVKHAKHPARIPACEHPAALLRLLRDTVHHLQDGQTLPGQYTCSQKELTAAGDVIALREASLGAAEYAVWRSVTLAADAGARARQQFEDRVGPDGKVSAEGLMGCIEDLQRCQHELVVAAGDLILQDLLLALAKQHLHQYQTGWLQLPMPNSDVVQKLLAEAAPVSDACVVAATELQATLSSLTDTQEKGIGDS